MELINSIIGAIIAGGLAGSLVLYLLREIVSERLKRSIKLEYDKKLEELRDKLYTKRELYQLRTSLFFDHQREAFAALLSQIAETVRIWAKLGYDPDLGLVKPVPSGEYEKLEKLFYNHQLFLDSDCIVAVQLVLDAMSDSFPVDTGDGERQPRDVYEPYYRVEFLRDRIAAVFQEKIGLVVSPKAKTEIALLGAIRLVNWHHITEVGLPVEGALKLDRRDNASDAVIKAREHITELVMKLSDLQDYLKRELTFGDLSLTDRVAWYIDILGGKHKQST